MKKLAFIGVLSISLTLTGCMQEYQLSEAETGITAEYMAGVLLAQDERYRTSLLAMDQLELHNQDTAINVEDESVVKEGKKKKEESTSELFEEKETSGQKGDIGEVEEMNVKTSLSEVMGTSDFDIRYMESEIYDAYPENESNAYFSLTAREGNQLLVASFSVENKTEGEKRLNLKKAGINYQLDINVGTVYKPSLTLLENDLRLIDVTIGAGKKKTVILVFEITKEAAMKDVNLIISKDAKSEIIQIK